MKQTEVRTTGTRSRHPSEFNGDNDAPPRWGPPEPWPEPSPVRCRCGKPDDHGDHDRKNLISHEVWPPDPTAAEIAHELLTDPAFAPSARFSSAGVIDFVERAIRSAIPGFKAHIKHLQVSPGYSYDDSELLSATVKVEVLFTSVLVPEGGE